MTDRSVFFLKRNCPCNLFVILGLFLGFAKISGLDQVDACIYMFCKLCGCLYIFVKMDVCEGY